MFKKEAIIMVILCLAIIALGYIASLLIPYLSKH
jgi:hypothetical protein